MSEAARRLHRDAHPTSRVSTTVVSILFYKKFWGGGDKKWKYSSVSQNIKFISKDQLDFEAR
jgi:hypothetical protein